MLSSEDAADVEQGDGGLETTEFQRTSMRCLLLPSAAITLKNDVTGPLTQKAVTFLSPGAVMAVGGGGNPTPINTLSTDSFEYVNNGKVSLAKRILTVLFEGTVRELARNVALAVLQDKPTSTFIVRADGGTTSEEAPTLELFLGLVEPPTGSTADTAGGGIRRILPFDDEQAQLASVMRNGDTVVTWLVSR